MPEQGMTRRALAMAGLTVAALPDVAFADPTDPDFMNDGSARGGRLAVETLIDDQGPFRFVIDSAANASVIAEDLAQGLNLPPSGTVGMNTLVAREVVETVRAARLKSGALDVRSPRLVLASRLGLNGADGLIGADLLSELRLVLNFRGRARSTISRSRRPGAGFFDMQLPTTRFDAAGEQRFGGLLTVDGRSRDVPFKAIVDTGAEVTIINTALAERARARPVALNDGSRTRKVHSPTGLWVEARTMILPDFHFAGVGLRDLPVLVGDFHTFEIWGFGDRPAALLGVDVLGLFQTVVVDLKRGELTIDI